MTLEYNFGRNTLDIPTRLELPKDPNKREEKLEVIKLLRDQVEDKDNLGFRLNNVPCARSPVIAHYVWTANGKGEPLEKIQQRIDYTLSILILTRELANESTKYSVDIRRFLKDVEGYQINQQIFASAVRNLDMVLYPEKYLSEESPQQRIKIEL